MNIGELKKAIKDVPDDMEMVIDLFGNQHDLTDIGIARCCSDGRYCLLDDEDVDFIEDADTNFLIRG